MYPRHLRPIVREMLAEFRIVHVVGPRQSGKTTLARGIASELGMRYLTLDDPAVRAAAVTDPHGLIRSIDHASVVLDEFQYVPELIPAIKASSDRDGSERKGKFLLTGSADILRSTRAQEALPGHLARLELLPLSLTELHGQSFNLVDYLLVGDLTSPPPGTVVPSRPPTRDDVSRLVLLGGYPEVQAMSPRARNVWFRSYTEGRFFKDFETLHAARGDYHSRLRALAPYLAGYSANLLKYASLVNALDLDDKLAKSYVEILELMFVVRRVPAYRKNRAKRMAVRMPKLHFLDTGLASHLLGLRQGAPLLASPHYGSLVETLVFAECAKHAEWAEAESDLYHFRDKRGREVDLVLERHDGRIVGIKVKVSATVLGRDFNALATLAEVTGDAFRCGVIFYTGGEVLTFHRPGARLYALPLGLLMSGEKDYAPALA